MATHHQGDAHIRYYWRWTCISTPAWFDRADTPLSRWLNVHTAELHRMHYWEDGDR